MPTRNPDAYGWVVRDGAYEYAGCLTVVCGLEVASALRAVGADGSRQGHHPDAFAAEGMAAIAVSIAPASEPAVVLVEENGYEGSRTEVLKALSKKGSAASAFWNVNGVVRFGCARRGKAVYTAELPAYEQEDVPRVLRKLVSAAETDDADLIAIAVAMAVTYTGVEVPHTDDVLQPSRFYPIANPVLGLPVTPEELIGLQYPTRELVAAAQAATPEACRRLTKWAALDAVDNAGLRDQPAVAVVVDQLDDLASPVALGSAFIDLRNMVSRGLDIASDAVGEAYNSSTTDADMTRLADESRAWGRRHCAVQALVYAAVSDPITAALGATYCATIPYRLGSEAAARFHQEALDVLT